MESKSAKILSMYRNSQYVKVVTSLGTYEGIISSIYLHGSNSMNGGICAWFRIRTGKNVESEWISVLFVQMIIEM